MTPDLLAEIAEAQKYEPLRFFAYPAINSSGTTAVPASDYDRLRATFERVCAVVKMQEKDAERYHFLRDQKEALFYIFPEEEVGHFGASVDLVTWPMFNELDERIDAVLRAEKAND